MSGKTIVNYGQTDFFTPTNLAELRRLPSSRLFQGANAFVDSDVVIGDLGGGFYVYSTTSTLAEISGSKQIIKPNDIGSNRPGRWIQNAGGVQGPQGPKGDKGDNGGLTIPEIATGLNYVVVHIFRLPGETDDTAAMRRALATGRPVRMVAGQGTGNGGEYQLFQTDPYGPNSLINRSNVYIFGDGRNKTIIRPKQSDGYALHGSSPPGSGVGSNYRNIRIEDVTFKGWVEEQGFQEHTHLVSLSGVSDVWFERCSFIGFRGDGIYIGRGNIGNQDYHNERVTVRDCYFDGLNNNNRNGISFIDINTSLVEGTTFARCSRNGEPSWSPTNLNFDKFDPSKGPGMPGAIDYEPDSQVTPTIHDNTVRKCRFIGSGGNVATVGVHVPDTVTGAVSGLTIDDCEFQGSINRGHEVYFQQVRLIGNPMTQATPGNGLKVVNCRGYGGSSPYGIFSAKDVIFQNNSWEDYRSGSLISYANDDRSFKVMNMLVQNERFIRVAQLSLGSGVSMSIFNVDNLKIDGCYFEDCGNSTPTAYILDFNNGVSSNVTITNNRVSNLAGKTGHRIITEASHTTNPVGNRLTGNDWGTGQYLNVSFNAQQTDMVQTYVPVMEGGSNVGTATYVRQYGEFRRNGNWVEGYAEVVVSGHTGSGPIEIGVPVNPVDRALADGLSYPCSLVIETNTAGAAGDNKIPVAQVHGFATTTNGEGAIRLYTMDVVTGVKTAYNIGNNPYTIFVRFAYQAQAGF